MVDRRKVLIEQYKQMKPEMGVFMIRARSSGRCYLKAAADLKSTINSTVFKLRFGNHPEAELQHDWDQFGTDGFEIKILDTLEYAKDESKTDYDGELEELRVMWEKKLTDENVTLYGVKEISS